MTDYTQTIEKFNKNINTINNMIAFSTDENEKEFLTEWRDHYQMGLNVLKSAQEQKYKYNLNTIVRDLDDLFMENCEDLIHLKEARNMEEYHKLNNEINEREDKISYLLKQDDVRKAVVDYYCNESVNALAKKLMEYDIRMDSIELQIVLEDVK